MMFLKWIPFSLVFGSCGISKLSHVKNVPGEDSSLAVLLGQGLNPIENRAKGHCVELGALGTQSSSATGDVSEFRLLEITSEAQLRESLQVSASASFSMLTGTAIGGRAAFAQSVSKSSQSRYLMVHTRVANQLELAKSFSFTEQARQLLASGNQKEFARHCGTEFVYGRRTGGEFFGIFEFEFANSEEERKFSLAISASGVGWKSSGALNHELSKFNMNARTHVKLYRQGGSGVMPEVAGLEDFARKFPTLVNATSGGAVTLELITKDYGGVEPFDVRADIMILAQQQSIMQQLAQNRDQALEMIRDIRYIQRNPNLYNIDGPTPLPVGERSLNSYINTQNRAAVNCMTDVFSGCSVPEEPFPSVVLPTRRAYDQGKCLTGWEWDPKESSCCQNQISRVCSIPSPEGCIAWELKEERACQKP